MVGMLEEHRKGVSQLVRQNALSHTDWLKLIEARRALIQPHLNTMDLQPIEKVRVCQYSSDDSCLISQGDPEVSASPAILSLSTRCYYPTGDGFYSNYLQSAIEHTFASSCSAPSIGCDETFWALSRSGTWLLITATVQFPKNYFRRFGHEIERSRVAKVTITESSVSDIIAKTKTTPEKIWQELGKLARQWHDRRSELLCDSKRLAEVFDFEDQLMEFVQK